MVPMTTETLWRQSATCTLGCTLGEIWLARNEAGGICAVLLGAEPARLWAEWDRRFPSATWRDAPTDEALETMLAYLHGERVDLNPLPLAISGTPFQERVWAALRRIPYGETRSYRELAAELTNREAAPRTARAVGSACGRNPVALLIPCHRATRSDGGLGGYYWGLAIKRALLQMEAAGAANSFTSADQLPLY